VAARKALERLSARLSAEERRSAEAALREGTGTDGRLKTEGVVLTDWILALASGSTTEATLEQYRAYRRVLAEQPASLRAQVYRSLPPQQALAADAGLSLTGPAGEAWRAQTGLLAAGKLTAESYADWMDDWLRSHAPGAVTRA
jgi:hypothetical protein